MTNEKQAKETIRMQLLEKMGRYIERVDAGVKILPTAEEKADAREASEVLVNLATAYAALCKEGEDETEN